MAAADVAILIASKKRHNLELNLTLWRRNGEELGPVVRSYSIFGAKIKAIFWSSKLKKTC